MKTLSPRQREIVLKALEIISTQGVQNFTMKTLSGEIGVTDAAVYKHFNSKDEIIMYLLRLFEETFLDIQNFVDDFSKNSIEKLECIFDEKFNRVSKNPEQVIVMDSMDLFRGNEDFKNEFIKITDKYKNNFMKVIKQGQKEQLIEPNVDSEHIYYMMIGSIHFLMKNWDRTNMGFDLIAEGKKLWKSVKKTISIK